MRCWSGHSLGIQLEKGVALRARVQGHPNRTDASEDQPCAIGVEWLHQPGIVAETIFLA